jgi:chemotaxis protein CheX
MKAEYINPFISATHDVFLKTLDCGLTRGRLEAKANHTPAHDISGIITLSGQAAGTVVVSLSRELAIQATAVMIGERPEGIDAQVIASVGELANMVAGCAKSRLKHLSLSISLPEVICGKHHTVSFPSDTTPIVIPFDGDWGEVSVEIGLAER